MRFRCILIVFLAFLFSNGVYAQYVSKNKKANTSFEKAQRSRVPTEYEALLKETIEIDSAFIDAYYMLGDLYCSNDMYEKGINYYQLAIDKDKRPAVKSFILIGRAKMENNDFEGAISSFNIALQDKNISLARRVGVEKLVTLSLFRDSLMKNPVDYNPINMGSNINTEHQEYWPTQTVDKETFMLTRNVVSGYYPNGFPKMAEDFYISKKAQDGTWGLAKNVGPPINTKKNEGALALAPDGRFVYFVGCNREDGKGSCDIYIAIKDGDLWRSPMNLKPINTSRFETAPSFSSDGKTLYFVRGISMNKGNNIWKSEFDVITQQWATPEPIKEINTDGEEQAPFIHPDGQTLYFISDGHPGLGGRDIFYSRKGVDGKWGKPINIGYPINSKNDENGLSVSSEGLVAYVSSAKEGGYGSLDLYSFELPAYARPQKVTYAKGKVYDMYTKLPLGAIFELINVETEEVVVRSESDRKNGEFLVCLPINNDYALHVSKDGYLFYSETFSLTAQGSAADPFILDVPLQPKKAGGTVVLKNVFFKTNKFDLLSQSQAELNKLSKFLKDNAMMKIELGGHTDDVGDIAKNQILSENRAKEVLDYLVKNGIEESRLEFKGYGSSKPIATNDTPEGRQQNRRTDFTIIALE